MAGLNIAIQEACEKFLFHDIRLPKSDSNLSHPFYTDDALFIGDWSQNNLKNLARILWCFHVASALKLTFINRRLILVLLSPLKKFVEYFFGVEPTRREKYYGSLGLNY
uniref:Uncharacterized protein n=1 Tax=Lactuca sativa TaxID=4236 RepID=A0A9R1UFQ4_LACSA|nr:hypothetical protein LSAT_V11C900480660 [Lactuca sativa]